MPRTMLVLSVLLAAVVGAPAQDSSEALPRVIQHAEPIYPPLARQLGVDGEVLVKVTTDGESVRNAEAETGNPLLRKAAEDNIRTWKFATHTPGTLHVTFRYKILSSAQNIEFLESPAIVRIEASPPKLFVDVSTVPHGAWKAQLTSSEGKSSRTFNLSYFATGSGYLSGNAVGPNGESEGIEFGHKEGDFLAFAITLTRPHGQEVRTFFIGKLKGDEIIGTFIDDDGREANGRPSGWLTGLSLICRIAGNVGTVAGMASAPALIGWRLPVF